jgi:hypothetical protein
MIRFDGQVALITGSGRGMGEAAEVFERGVLIRGGPASGLFYTFKFQHHISSSHNSPRACQAE